MLYRAVPRSFLAGLRRPYSTEATGSVKLAPPAGLNAAEKHVFEKLVKELEPTRLDVQDVSGGCGSMYAITIASQKFKGLPMVRQHKLVNEVLKDEIATWHGIQLRTKLE